MMDRTGVVGQNDVVMKARTLSKFGKALWLKSQRVFFFLGVEFKYRRKVWSASVQGTRKTKGKSGF